MDIDVERNAYGRQIDSRVVEHRRPSPTSSSAPPPGKLEAVFIRAPIIRRVGDKAQACWPIYRAIRCWWSRAAPGRHLPSRN